MKSQKHSKYLSSYKFQKSRKKQGISLWYSIILENAKEKEKEISKALALDPWWYNRITWENLFNK